MGVIRVIPTVLTQNFLSGATVTGVAPVSTKALLFDYDNLAVASFEAGEALSWTGGTGTLVRVSENDDGLTGTMRIVVLTGVDPTDGLTITGGASGATGDVDGVPENGYDSEETIERGRYREFIGLSNGGLVDINPPVSQRGYRVIYAMMNLPGITAVEFVVEDEIGGLYSGGITTPSAGKAYTEFIADGLLVPPNCKFKMVGTGTLSGAGRFMLVLGSGWGDNVFSDNPGLGMSNLPPGMQRPQV